jgi:hypothetical protein
MITTTIDQVLLTQSEMSEQGITSVLDNFGTGVRIYYQGDEPIIEQPIQEENV